jgi:Uma2 family endonuclease
MAVPKPKLMTIAEFEQFTARSENADRLFELINGEIVEKVASFKPSRIAACILRYVDTFVDEHNLGYVTGADGSYILSDEDEFMPDVGYIAKERLPVEPERQVQGPPDLAVEVKSPTDSKRKLRLKAEDYLRFDTKAVWLVFPEDQRIEVYELDQDVQELGIDGVLTGGDVLPGFSLPVKELFR